MSRGRVGLRVEGRLRRLSGRLPKWTKLAKNRSEVRHGYTKLRSSLPIRSKSTGGSVISVSRYRWFVRGCTTCTAALTDRNTRGTLHEIYSSVAYVHGHGKVVGGRYIPLPRAPHFELQVGHAWFDRPEVHDAGTSGADP